MTQTTVTTVCNQALGACGARATITNLNENSNEARACRLYYENTRDALLRAAQWNFSRKEDYLTLIKAAPGTPENPNPPIGNTGAWNPQTMPALPWLYSYAVPSDSVRTWQILPQLQTTYAGNSVPIFSSGPNSVPPPLIIRKGVKFIEGLDVDAQGNQTRCILTNQEQAVAVYGLRVENPDLWDAQFETAMVNALAWRICIPVSGDKTLAKMAHDTAVETIREARMTDGNSGLTNVNTIPDWIAIRGFVGDWSTNFDAGYIAGWANPSFLGL